MNSNVKFFEPVWREIHENKMYHSDAVKTWLEIIRAQDTS